MTHMDRYDAVMEAKPTVQLLTSCYDCPLTLMNPRTQHTLDIDNVFSWSVNGNTFCFSPLANVSASFVNEMFQKGESVTVMHTQK